MDKVRLLLGGFINIYSHVVCKPVYNRRTNGNELVFYAPVGWVNYIKVFKELNHYDFYDLSILTKPYYIDSIFKDFNF
jgi:hypothetical protein